MKSVILAVIVAATGTAQGQNWLDDFGDGSAVDGTPVSWTASPSFPFEFTVIDGDLVVSMQPGASPAISSTRVPVNFPSGASVRVRMQGFQAPGRYAVALADEKTGIQGYVASFSSCGGGQLELFRGDVLGSIVHLGSSPDPWPYSPTVEHYLQLDVFNGVVSARVWRPGEPFPVAQISAHDSTYTQGVASVAIQDFGSGNCFPTGDFDDVYAVVRFAQASSTPLTHSGAGDLDADGVIATSDLIILLSSWGPCAGACPPSCSSDIAPIGGDCTVDMSDLLMLLADWG